MMHRKQVSTRSYESDTNDRPFSVWVLTILTSEACHHSAELRAPHTQSSIHPHTDTDHGVTRGSLSPLTRCVQSSPPHQPQPTRSDITALIWTILPCQPSVSPPRCKVDCNYPGNKKYIFSIFPASDIAAASTNDDPMELGWIVNNASNLFLSKEINP